MTAVELKATLSRLTGETDDVILDTFLEVAGRKIIEKCYPYRSDVTEVPEKYIGTQLEISAYLLNKRGADGETAHDENGISRTYENASVPDSMLRGVIPFASTILRTVKS